MPRRNHKKKQSKQKHTKKAKAKSALHDKTWIRISFIIVTIISVIMYFYINHSLSKTQAKEEHIKQLANEIIHLQPHKVETLVSQYSYNFNNEATYSQFESLMKQFFLEWTQKINDDEYNIKEKILKLLIQHTNIHDFTEICICNYAAQYRLIDALQLILSSMTVSSIKECFSHKTQTTNNTIFHTITKSKSASFARLILKFGYNNPKLQMAAERLYIDIPQRYSNTVTHTVFHNDIQQMQSQIDIEMVVSAAINANMDSHWFYQKNSEGYTGFDYWILNHGQNKHSEILKQQSIKDIAQSVAIQDCNFDKEILFKNTCSPQIIYDWNDFDIYWKQQRAVIIKNGLLNANDVTFDALMRRFGDLSVMVSEIPYATLFNQKAWSIPIKEYINVILKGTQRSNFYAFDKTLISNNKDLQTFFNFTIPFMDGDEIRSKYHKIYQLALGPIHSGAPPHWHQPAFNGLFQGKKIWWMFSPKQSMYSSMNIMNWLKNEYKQKLMKSSEIQKHYCFIQEKGDVVFVPSQWSHAVQNLQPSLAVAIEYNI